MAVTNGLGTYGDGAGVVTPLAHRQAQLGLITKNGAGTNAIRAGLFFDGVTNIVTGTAGMSYNVAPFTAVSSRGASQGAVLFANDGTVNVATTAAPGTNSRIDVVYVWQREFALDGGSTEPVIGVVQGTAGSSPAVPSLAAFPGAIELARITVPAGVTATNSGTTITQTAPFTAAAGAPLHARSVSELPVSANRNQVAVSTANADRWVFNGTSWNNVQSDGFRWANAAARTAQTGMRAGDRGFQVDTGAYYQYSGSAWAFTAYIDTDWTTPTFVNGWSSDGAQAVRYRRINGIVYLRGRLTGGSTATAFSMPAGFYPANTMLIGVGSGTTPVIGRIIITTTGSVQGVSGQQPNLDGYSFPAEP